MTFPPSQFDTADRANPASRVDPNAMHALGKLQADSQQPTNYVNQAKEQNNDTVIRNVEPFTKDNYWSDSPTNLIEQATEQKTDGAKRKVDVPPEPPTNLVNQAAEQNKDTVTRNVEALLNQNFQSDKNSPYLGIHAFFNDDLETNLKLNVGQVLARASLQADIESGKMPRLGVVGELSMPQPKDFWHETNEKIDVTKFVGQNFKAFRQDPKMVSEAIKTLEKQINQNMQSANLGKPLEGARRDNMRQFAENAIMIKLAVAEAKFATDPQGAKDIINGKSGSVNRLIGIAGDYGANKENLEQLKKMADEIAGR